jgi:hypothetical protein
MMNDIEQTRNQIRMIDRNITITKWVLRASIISLLFIFMTSCACYHCPTVYKNRAGIPTSVQVPHYKNTKSNKYGPKKPYYGKPEKKKRRYGI